MGPNESDAVGMLDSRATEAGHEPPHSVTYADLIPPRSHSHPSSDLLARIRAQTQVHTRGPRLSFGVVRHSSSFHTTAHLVAGLSKVQRFFFLIYFLKIICFFFTLG